MSPEPLPSATVIIVSANHLAHLERCVPSVLGQQYDKMRILVVDNASTDGSVEFLKREYPQVQIIENSTNLGYAGANNVGFQNSASDYLAVLNPDTEVADDWLRELILALETCPAAGLATSKVLLLRSHERINTCGNEITFAGITTCRGLGQPADRYARLERVSAVSGSAFAIRRSVLQEIGPFDESFFLYYEDTDLSLRAALAGYQCLYVPTSIVYHDYAFRFTASKAYLQERNRIVSLLKVFRWGTLAALLPALLLAEAMAWTFCALKGKDHLRSKLRSYGWIVRNRRQVWEARRETQALRRVGDRRLLRTMSHRLSFAGTTNRQAARALEAIVQPFLWAWGGLCRAVVFW